MSKKIPTKAQRQAIENVRDHGHPYPKTGPIEPTAHRTAVACVRIGWLTHKVEKPSNFDVWGVTQTGEIALS